MRDVGGARLQNSADQAQQAGQARRSSVHRRGGPAVSPEQHQLRRREAVPDSGDSDAAAVPDAAGRRVLHRQAAQGHGEHAQAVRRVRLHRFRARACHSSPFPNTDKIDLTLTVDEGKQFFVRRIDFSGNTTTRDKVIRREIADRRRRHVQHAPVGTQHPAPEPARLLRAVEGGGGRRHQARHARPIPSISRSR